MSYLTVAGNRCAGVLGGSVHRGIWAVAPAGMGTAENLRVDALFHCRGTATEAAVGYNGFRLRCDLRVRAGMHCAPPR